MKLYLIILFLILISTSCIIQSPRYTNLENVFHVTPGMTIMEVDSILDLKPYNLKSKDQDGNFVYIYKYRVKEVRRIPFVMKGNQGFDTEGKYADLFVYCSKEGIVNKVESCINCEEVEEKETKIDYKLILTLITTTLPAVLIYLGLK